MFSYATLNWTHFICSIVACDVVIYAFQIGKTHIIPKRNDSYLFINVVENKTIICEVIGYMRWTCLLFLDFSQVRLFTVKWNKNQRQSIECNAEWICTHKLRTKQKIIENFKFSVCHMHVDYYFLLFLINHMFANKITKWLLEMPF